MATHAHPPVPAISQPAQVAHVALHLVGQKASRFYPANPRRACAAFVSFVLIRSGSLRQDLGTPSAQLLVFRLQRHGYHRVAGPGRVVRVARQTQPGDVLFFLAPGHRHVTLSVARGGDSMVGNSSSRRRIVRVRVSRFRAASLTIYRR